MDDVQNVDVQNSAVEFPAAAPQRVRVKKCPKCGKKKFAINKFFDRKLDSSDGFQSYCKECKSDMHKRKRQTNINFRIRHHFTTRIRGQLAANCPIKLGRKELNELLGYRLKDLRISLDAQIQRDEGINIRTAIDAGYHIDHIRPLVSFGCFEVATEAGKELFKECWAISNLKLIPAEDNLAKGAKYDAAADA